MKRKLAGVTVAVAAAAWGALRYQRIQRVAPELRHPLLWLPLSYPHPAMVPLMRRFNRVTLWFSNVPPVPEGVLTQMRFVPGLGEAPPVPVKLYEPAEGRESRGAIVWIHGGGLMLGGLDSGEANAIELVRELGVLVVSVDYRLAPEHKFPAAIDDCMAVLRWVHDLAVELDIDPRRVAVGGDSAGGGLAACLAQRATDEGVPVAFQALIYPMLDDRTVLHRNDNARACFIWDEPSNRTSWWAYRGTPPQYDIVPEYLAAARREHLEGLPPAWVGVGDLDLFFQENVDYTEALHAAGVDCELHVVPGMYHSGDHLVAPRPAGPAEMHASMIAALRAAIV